MKVAYKKSYEFCLFGIKIAHINCNYIEHSIDKDDDDNGLFVDLQTRIVNGGDKRDSL